MVVLTLFGMLLVVRLGYFERKHKFYDQKQLLSEITGHYSQQVEHAFLLILTLNIIIKSYTKYRNRYVEK